MQYTVELSFSMRDADTLSNYLEDLANPDTKHGWNPHITLAVFEECDVDSLIAITTAFAQETAAFTVQLASVGLFPQEPAAFLAPVVTQDLVARHRRLHDALTAGNLQSAALYSPGNWVPHCTMVVGGSIQEQLAYLNRVDLESLLGEYRIDAVRVMQYGPMACLATAPLQEQA